MRDGRIDAADFGIHRQLGALLGGSRRVELSGHRLVLNLRILLPEFGIGATGIKRLNILEPLCIEFLLRLQPGDVGGRLFVVRFQDLGLLLRRGK